MRTLLVVVAALVFAGCPPVDDSDHVPPRVLGVDPALAVVPVTTTWKLTFSEPMNEKTLSSDPLSEDLTVVLAPRDIVSDTFLSDLNNPPLIDSRASAIAPITVALVDGGTVLTVAPTAPLKSATAYELIVSPELRDRAGNPLADASGNKNPFILDFTTDAGPPAVASTDLPTGSSLVAPNQKRITVTFNQPVQNVTTDTLSLSPAAPVDAILVSTDRTVATLLLGDPATGCARLTPNSDYTLVATDGITGDTGQALEPYSQPFSTGAACDTVPNVLSDLDHTDGEVEATIHFTTSKPSTTEVRFGVAGGALDCLGGTCPVVGAPTTTANASHAVTVTGLVVNTDYDFTVSAEDAVGSVATGTGTVHTAPLPKVSVNEMLADTAAGHDDDAGEFIELASFEASQSLDLSGWTLTVSHNGTSAVHALPVPGPVLQPGAFLVVASPAFDGTIYGSVDEADVVRVSLSPGLSNTDPLLIELKDQNGRPVSSMTAPKAKEGVSVERIAPDAPDDAASFCSSRTDIGPTPGRQNGVVAAGCE